MSPGQEARVKIDQLLEQAGWRVFKAYATARPVPRAESQLELAKPRGQKTLNKGLTGQAVFPEQQIDRKKCALIDPLLEGFGSPVHREILRETLPQLLADHEIQLVRAGYLSPFVDPLASVALAMNSVSGGVKG